MNTSHPEQLLLQTSLEYLQLEIRIGIPVLQSDFITWGHLAMSCWLKYLWSFVSSAQLQLIPNQPETFPLQRDRDACIMDKVQTFNPTLHQLAAFNHCCMAHRVFFLLDIMDGWGHLLWHSILSPQPTQPPDPGLGPGPWAAMAKDNWLTWQYFLPQLAAATVLSLWISPPQLLPFIPFDPISNTAYILQVGQFWQMYQLSTSHWTRQIQMLFPSAITLNLIMADSKAYPDSLFSGVCTILGPSVSINLPGRTARYPCPSGGTGTLLCAASHHLWRNDHWL